MGQQMTHLRQRGHEQRKKAKYTYEPYKRARTKQRKAHSAHYWTTQQCVEWLTKYDFGPLAQRFAQEGREGDDLLAISSEALATAYGVTGVQAVRLVQLVRSLRQRSLGSTLFVADAFHSMVGDAWDEAAHDAGGSAPAGGHHHSSTLSAGPLRQSGDGEDEDGFDSQSNTSDEMDTGDDDLNETFNQERTKLTNPMRSSHAFDALADPVQKRVSRASVVLMQGTGPSGSSRNTPPFRHYGRSPGTSPMGTPVQIRHKTQPSHPLQHVEEPAPLRFIQGSTLLTPAEEAEDEDDEFAAGDFGFDESFMEPSIATQSSTLRHSDTDISKPNVELRPSHQSQQLWTDEIGTLVVERHGHTGSAYSTDTASPSMDSHASKSGSLLKSIGKKAGAALRQALGQHQTEPADSERTIALDPQFSSAFESKVSAKDQETSMLF
eukprot:m.131626 g.131626  ORF g.131626 m.131626 type:complete len:436 (-) comp13922_c0_seq1:750-2057(-)